MDETIRTIIIAIIGSSAFTALVNGILDIFKNRTGVKKNEKKALNFCLLSALQTYGEKLCSTATIEKEDYLQFDEMYKTYKALGGNGYADRLKKEVDKIPFGKGHI